MNVAEVGVYQGHSIPRIMRMYPDATLWLFDSFHGHDDPCEHDDAKAHPKGRYSDTSFEDIQRRYPKAIIIGGAIRNVWDLSNYIGNLQFRFARIDVDHYKPTKIASEFFKSHMEPGGVIEFDDYRHLECPGATKAIDEVFGQTVLAGSGEFGYHWINQ